MDELFQKLIGECLSAVTFVKDYYQFQFDGPLVNVMTPVMVTTKHAQARTGDEPFRNLVCDQIAKVVAATEVRRGDAIDITFMDGSRLSFSLLESDRVGPEAIVFFGLDQEWDVL